MILQSSLALRLATHLVIALLLAYVGFFLLFIGMSLAGLWSGNDLYWDDLAFLRTKEMVIASITDTDGQRARLVPTQELLREMRRVPSLQFAAFNSGTGEALSGSSVFLAETLGELAKIKTRGGIDFTLDDSTGLLGELSREQVRSNTYNIMIYGVKFNWRDIPYGAWMNLTHSVRYNAPIWVFALAVGWLSLRRGLRPLREAAKQAEQIDINSLDQRISPHGIPVEIAPLISTINGALARLDTGAERQRRFVANSAHELRTPVAILKSRVDALERSAAKGLLSKDVRRIQNIVEQLLIASRYGEGRGPEMREFDIIELLDEMVADYAPLVLVNKRHIALDAAATPMMVLGDRRLLSCVLANLIDNALGSEPVGGTIVVRAHTGAIIDVVDHGPGISLEDREEIFDPFWRKDETRPGSGLGLAIVKELVTLHAGDICVEDTVGGGATFRISFKTAQA